MDIAYTIADANPPFLINWIVIENYSVSDLFKIIKNIAYTCIVNNLFMFILVHLYWLSSGTHCTLLQRRSTITNIYVVELTRVSYL